MAVSRKEDRKDDLLSYAKTFTTRIYDENTSTHKIIPFDDLPDFEIGKMDEYKKKFGIEKANEYRKHINMRNLLSSPYSSLQQNIFKDIIHSAKTVKQIIPLLTCKLGECGNLSTLLMKELFEAEVQAYQKTKVNNHSYIFLLVIGGNNSKNHSVVLFGRGKSIKEQQFIGKDIDSLIKFEDHCLLLDPFLNEVFPARNYKKSKLFIKYLETYELKKIDALEMVWEADLLKPEMLFQFVDQIKLIKESCDIVDARFTPELNKIIDSYKNRIDEPYAADLYQRHKWLLERYTKCKGKPKASTKIFESPCLLFDVRNSRTIEPLQDDRTYSSVLLSTERINFNDHSSNEEETDKYNLFPL